MPDIVNFTLLSARKVLPFCKYSWVLFWDRVKLLENWFVFIRSVFKLCLDGQSLGLIFPRNWQNNSIVNSLSSALWNRKFSTLADGKVDGLSLALVWDLGSFQVVLGLGELHKLVVLISTYLKPWEETFWRSPEVFPCEALCCRMFPCKLVALIPLNFQLCLLNSGCEIPPDFLISLFCSLK